MLYISISIIIVICGFAIAYGNYRSKINQEQEQLKQFYETRYKEEYIKENSEKLKKQIQKDTQFFQDRLEEVEADLKQRIASYHQLQDTYSKLNQQLQEQQERVTLYEIDQTARIDERMLTYEANRRAAIDTCIAIEAEEKQKAANDIYSETMAQLLSQIKTAEETKEALEKQIREYTEKQVAINEAIRRQRALEEKQEFYRICVPEDFIEDINTLQLIKKNLKKSEIIDKIIYDNYIAKPVLEMIKRVLQNSTCSGIYKITCLKTGEVYIGKSTDVKSRWQQHCKTVFNCGTIASSLLHTKMKQYGIENFTFELIEQVPKDQLSEREKFYINFYQTKEVGLNERNG